MSPTKTSFHEFLHDCVRTGAHATSEAVRDGIGFVRQAAKRPRKAPVQTASASARLRVGDVSDVTDWVPSADDVISADAALLSSDAIELDDWSPVVDTDTATVEEDGTITEDAKKPKAKPPTSSGVATLKSIQTKLVALGYSVGKSGVDGKMGPATAGAITRFKKDRKIMPMDGKVTSAFRAALAAAKPGGSPTTASVSAAAISNSTLVLLGAVGSGALLWASAPLWIVSAPLSLAVLYTVALPAVKKK